MREIVEFLRPPPIEVLMTRELDHAKRDLLAAQSAREYADAMVGYNERKIDRLRSQIDLVMAQKGLRE